MITLLVVAAAAVAVVAADKEKKTSKESPMKPEAAQKKADEGNLWIQAKLHSAQQIFASLTQGGAGNRQDAGSGHGRRQCSGGLAKKSEFKKKSAYQGQLNAFEFANKELIRNAEDENIDGALEAWVKLSRSCVECHKLIPDVERK